MDQSVRKCRFCGKELEPHGGWAKGRPRTFCDKTCRHKHAYQQNREAVKKEVIRRYHADVKAHRDRAKYFRAVKQRNLRTDKLMSDLERGYVAGLVDGEGTLGLQAERQPLNVSGIKFAPRFAIYNTDLAILTAARDAMGNGSITKQAESSEARRAIYRLSLTPNQIRHVLPQIKEVLAGKKRQAVLLLQYLDLAVGGRNSAKNFDEEKDIYRQLRAMNRRGRGANYSMAAVDRKLELMASCRE